MAVSIKDGDYQENSSQNVPSSNKVQEQRIQAVCFKSEKKKKIKQTHHHTNMQETADTSPSPPPFQLFPI